MIASARSILHLSCSPNGENSRSWRASCELVELLQRKFIGAEVICRRLDQSPPSFVDAKFAGALNRHQTAESAKSVPALLESESLIGELEASDILVVATPMHNFTVPASLKAWLDQVVRYGRTFQSVDGRKIGLLQDRPTYIVISSGGLFFDERARQPNYLTTYLRDIFATIGITSVHFLLLERLAPRSQGRTNPNDGFRRQIELLLDSQP